MISANNYKDLTEDEMWELFDKIDLDKQEELNQEQDSTEEQNNDDPDYLCTNCN